ncbi:hypothetical protein HK104_011219 [Borealophlyctis nickersoniae]|nr:hypothetical protein HK104_011219 [Borealophlyctis nickersoniae]
MVAIATASPFGSRLFFQGDDDVDYYKPSSGRGRQGGSIVDRLRGDERFSRFVDALERERGLRDDLSDMNKRSTVFAPTNKAFKHIEDEIMARKGKDHDRHPDMKEILAYHILPDQDISGDDLRPGMLLRTNLKPKSLEGHRQRIRVFKFAHEVYLNVHSRVVEKDMEAENGRIHVIDRVLMPPRDAWHMMHVFPTEFSTMIAAAERADMREDMERERGVTVLAPSNSAWKRLGMMNLAYLFARHEGRDDLKRIMKYHIGTDLAYSTRMMKEGEMRIKTRGKQELTLQACRRRRGHEGGRRSTDRDHRRAECEMGCRRGGGGGGRRSTDRKDRDRECDVRDFYFTLNYGEARISLTDGPTENGVIQVIDEVLIPEDVKLPYERV